MVLAAPVEVVVTITLGVLVLTIAGLMTAVVSKAIRDIRDRWAQKKFHEYRQTLQNPTAVTDKQAKSWARYGGLRREALLRAIVSLDSQPDREAPAASRIPQRDWLADALVRQLRVRDTPKRGLALLLLGHIGRADDCASIAACATDPDGDVRLCAIRALDQIATPAAFAALIGLLSSNEVPGGQSPLAQARIVERLAKPWAQPQLVPTLRALPAPDAHSRAHDLDCLTPGDRAPQGDPTVIGVLRAIGLSEGCVSAEEIIPWLRYGCVNERAAAVRALVACCVELDEPLFEAMSDPSPIVRGQAIKGLSSVKVDSEQLPRVLELLEMSTRDRDWWVRGYAATGLRKLGEPGLRVLSRVAAGDDAFAAHRAKEQIALAQPAARPAELAEPVIVGSTQGTAARVGDI